MNVKKTLFKSFLIGFFSYLVVYFYIKFDEKKILNQSVITKDEEVIYSANIIKGVNYVSRDLKGNEYIINADQGEIDLLDNNTIFLDKVKALVKLKNKENVIITSDYGKYNITTNKSIFSKNVIIRYLENKIMGDYSEISFERNSLMISKDVTYTNLENVLEADIIEMNILTKDIKISMYGQKDDVNIEYRN